MNTKAKRLIAVVMIISVCMSFMGNGAIASYVDENRGTVNLETTPVSLDNIEIYLDYVDENEAESVVQCTDDIEIKMTKELVNSEKELFYNHPAFAPTIIKAIEMREAGIKVNSIHFLIPHDELSATKDIATLANNDWRNNTLALGSYNGFEFRYVDSYIDGETDWINVDDIGNVNWTELATKGLIAVVPELLGTVGATANVIITLAELINVATVSPNIRYSYSDLSFVRYQAQFRHWYRHVYMSDTYDRVYGLDYYLPGTMERVEIDNHVSARWPTIAGWSSDSDMVGSQNIKTSGYDGNSTVYAKFVQSYYSTNGAAYNETIDIRETVIDFVLNNL